MFDLIYSIVHIVTFLHCGDPNAFFRSDTEKHHWYFSLRFSFRIQINLKESKNMKT
jgi:hypothetical protein